MTRSIRTELHSTPLNYGKTLILVHATPGTEPAGAGVRLRDHEGWLTGVRHPTGTTTGQWYATLAEAQARYDTIARRAREEG